MSFTPGCTTTIMIKQKATIAPILTPSSHSSLAVLQAEDPDVTLLKKARQEKKVKRYLEDNFRNREGRQGETEM